MVWIRRAALCCLSGGGGGGRVSRISSTAACAVATAASAAAAVATATAMARLWSDIEMLNASELVAPAAFGTVCWIVVSRGD